MANLRLYQNKNKKSKAYGKYYGRVKATKTLNTTQLANHIAEHGSIITEDVLLSTINKMTKCIKELLKDGKNVKLDGLGTFYLSVTSTGDSDAKAWTAAGNIKHVQIKFRPDGSDASIVSNARMLMDTQLELEDTYVNPQDAAQAESGGQAGGSGNTGDGDDNGDGDGSGDGDGDGSGGDNTEGGQPAPERP